MEPEFFLGVLCVCTHTLRMPAAAAAKSLQLCPTLCDPIDGSLPGSSVPGILQAKILEWVAISFSNAWKWKVKVKSLSCVRLCDPMDYSLPGSSVHGIFQARVLEWGAIAFSTKMPELGFKDLLFGLKINTWRPGRGKDNPPPPPSCIKSEFWSDILAGWNRQICTSLM